MGEYIVGVVGAAFCVGLLEELLPSEWGSKIYLRLLTGLCLLAILLAPVGRCLGGLSDLFSSLSFFEEEQENEYEEILRETVGEAVREELSAAVKRELSERFGVKDDGTSIGIQFREDGALSVSRLIIGVTGSDILKDPYEIEEYFEGRLGCECQVVVGGWK